MSDVPPVAPAEPRGAAANGDVLDLVRAADEAGSRTAMVGGALGATGLVYAELLRRVAAEPATPERLGDTSQGAVLGVLASLQARRPVRLVHPRWTEAERRRLPTEDVASIGDTAAIVFTSGTTGRPKGARLGRAALIAAAEASAARLGWREDDRWLLDLPLAHVGGLSILTRCLAARRCLVLPEPGGFSPERFLRSVEAHRVTLASVVPTMLKRLLEATPAPPPSLRAVLVGGAALDPGLRRRARDAGWPILATYGLTEACAQVATERPGEPSAGVGPPLPGVELRIVDGGIQLRGPTLFSGYVGEPERPRDAWYPTGDLGRLDADGHLHVHARRSDLVVSGGENVYPAEVEAALRGLPEVEDALVFGLPDAEWGQIVAAAVVARGSRRPSLESVRAALVGVLADYKRPRHLCWLARLPLGRTGKPDREAARRGCAEGEDAPEPTGAGRRDGQA